MKIYYPNEHYQKEYRGQLFPLLKPFIKSTNFKDKERLKTYHLSENEYEFVESINLCDIVILPMSWNYYVLTKKQAIAHQLIESAAQKNKKVWSWNAGDFGVLVPKFKNLKVFRMGGYNSNNQSGHIGIPIFIGDYLAKNFNSDICNKDKYSIEPIVGFCGQANLSYINAITELIKIFLRNLKTFVGFNITESQRLIASTRLRAKLLHNLIESPLIQDNFILRKKYRAGAITIDHREKTTEIFYDNILKSHYVLCVRGAGNFSVRFYETLMMGRIPVYLNTDGFLPLADQIDWKKHVVWVEYEERNQISNIVKSFHENLTRENFFKLSKSNRELWFNKLTLGGFFRNQKIL